MAKVQEAWSEKSTYIMQQARALPTLQSILTHIVKNIYIYINFHMYKKF